MITISDLKFDEKGLIPAVVVDSLSKKVLTVAYMNEESLKISLEKVNIVLIRCEYIGNDDLQKILILKLYPLTG